MHHWKTAFLTLVIFGLGGIAGGLLTAKIIRGKIEYVEKTRAGPEIAHGEWILQSIGVMEHMVKLQPEQVQKVRSIMRKAQQESLRARSVWQEKAAELTGQNGPEIRRLREEWQIKTRRGVEAADNAIRELLTEEQKPLFEEFIKKRRGVIQNRLRNGGPPPRPGDRPPLPPRPQP